LSIPHHTRKRPSTGPRTTHGPQSPPWWVHWQHKHIVTWEKKEKKQNKKKLQHAIESQRKEKRKITWRKVSNPLGKGNGSTHLRQNYAQAKSANHQSKARKPQRAPLHTCMLPLNQCSSPWTNACKTLDENKVAASAELWLVRPVDTTGQTGAQHVIRTSNLTCHTDDHDLSDRWHTETRNGSKPPESLLDAFGRPKHAQTSPPCWQCMNQVKNAKNGT
jgi:hypothetical protein